MSQLIARDLIEILKKNGFVFDRQNGSHWIFENSDMGASVTVPIHGRNNPIFKGTLASIIAQSKLPKEKFFKK